MQPNFKSNIRWIACECGVSRLLPDTSEETMQAVDKAGWRWVSSLASPLRGRWICSACRAEIAPRRKWNFWEGWSVIFGAFVVAGIITAIAIKMFP